MTQQSESTTATAAAKATKQAELNWLKSIAKELAALSAQRLEAELTWFARMPAKRRLVLGTVAAAGIDSFIRWYENPATGTWVTGDIFGSAPRELMQSVSLQQTLQMTQVVVAVVEERVAQKSQSLKDATSRFSRDVAFGAAHIYASAAEARGLWDARLEALIVDSIITGTADEELPSRIAALGWSGTGQAAVLVGTADRAVDIENIRRQARKHDCDALIGVQGSRLVLVFGLTKQATDEVAQQVFKTLTEALRSQFTVAPLVLGPTVPKLTRAHRSARAALSGVAVAPAYFGVQYPVHADQLLPERVIAGDALAKQTLLTQIYEPLAAAAGELLPTLRSYLANGRSLEQTSRELFVHTNTVRYRLKRIHELLDWQPTDPRDAFTLQTALVVGEVGLQALQRSEKRPKPR